MWLRSDFPPALGWKSSALVLQLLMWEQEQRLWLPPLSWAEMELELLEPHGKMDQVRTTTLGTGVWCCFTWKRMAEESAEEI